MAGVRQKLRKAEEELAVLPQEDHENSFYLHNEEFEAIRAIGVKEIDDLAQQKEHL